MEMKVMMMNESEYQEIGDGDGGDDDNDDEVVFQSVSVIESEMKMN